ncbi:MAG: ATP-dependent Clp protease proteolytic subunit [Clostridia bacterium]|nr:ATP-dependent Clp protease proteolytic subunit [Clostridia bacterium]
MNTEKDESKNELDQLLDQIEKNGSVPTDSKGGKIYCLSIIGQIEGHYTLPSDQKSTKYEHIVPLLVSIEQSKDVDGLLIVLNTMGGDVEAGLAISELISSMKKPTVSLVLGGGHSIGVPLAVSAEMSFIVPSATMTIHPVRVSGTIVGAPQTYYYFEKMQDRIIDFVTSHSRISEEKLRELMLATDQIATDTGSIVDGKRATELGLIDKIGGLKDAISYLEEQIEKSKSNNI